MIGCFERARPGDERPRSAIEVGRQWVATGVFSMPVIRGASLSAHAAAKETADKAAIAAAHAAGQAVATAHVPQHAYGGAYDALRAIAIAAPANAAAERAWQAARLPEHLRREIMDRIGVEETARGVRVTPTKGPDF